MSDISNISYRINERDEIIFVNDEWSEFALANDAPEFTAENVLDRRLWDFISNNTIRELYQQIIEKVRAGYTMGFNFRCDSDHMRRLLEMKISLLENKCIQFDTYLIKVEERTGQSIFQKNVRRGEETLMVCSWCKKIEIENGDWQEIEKAALKPELFETESLPQLSHGMCPACYQSITKKHQNTFTGKTNAA